MSGDAVMDQGMSSDKQILFVTGCARSGTSALVQLLNQSPDMLIGMERYAHRYDAKTLAPELFARERFCRIEEGDTHGAGAVASDGSDPMARYDRAQFVGDKYPALFQHFPLIEERFPRAKILFILRNPLSVAESYDARASDAADSWSADAGYARGLLVWNNSVARAVELVDRKTVPVRVVLYEELYQSVEQMLELFEYYGAAAPARDALAPIAARFAALKETPTPRRDDIRMAAFKTFRPQPYRALVQLAQDQAVRKAA